MLYLTMRGISTGPGHGMSNLREYYILAVESISIINNCEPCLSFGKPDLNGPLHSATRPACFFRIMLMFFVSAKCYKNSVQSLASVWRLVRLMYVA